ncbi:hypothetical protein M0R45_028378 [Rubus argutus]|uniref:Uncharacterized protein n=1 Tax=Rubus argutus TaxID=59490 RepID=A0AAW1W4I1_RUBAR
MACKFVSLALHSTNGIRAPERNNVGRFVMAGDKDGEASDGTPDEETSDGTRDEKASDGTQDEKASGQEGKGQEGKG